MLERAGVRYFRSRSTALPKLASADAVHYLNPEERAGLKRVERGAIVRACIAGAISTIVSAAAEVLANPLLPTDPAQVGWRHLAAFWGVVAGATLAASAVEIAYLYWDALRSVHELANVAGLELFPPAGSAGPAVAGALARAALELPNPSYQVYGIDPHRETSRLRLVAASVAYKAKVSVSNFAVKALVRRALVRAAVRTTLVPFVAVPLTAAWNGAVTWLVLREARLRAMGPSAAKELVRVVLDGAAPLSAEGKLAAVRAVASAIVRTRDLHPNLLALLLEVRERCGAPVDDEVDDAERFLKGLPALAPHERKVALQLLALATIIDGRLTTAEKRLLVSAQRAASLAPDLKPIEALRRAFVRGDATESELLAKLG